MGYKNQDIKNIISIYPLDKLKEETLEKRIKENYNYLLTLDYTKEEVIKMTKKLPTIFGLDIEKVIQKLEFYESIGLREISVNNSKMLMQSVDLSYARYKYLENIEIFITMQNYRLLFMGQKPFETQFGIIKSQILELYKYKETNNKIK